MTALVLGLREYVAERGASGLARDAWLVALALAPLWLCRNASLGSEQKVALCIAMACLVAAFDRAHWEQLATRSSPRRIAAYGLGLSVAFMLLRRSLDAGFWMIDDHEIADALAVGEVNTLSGLWHTLTSHREIGAPPWSYPRYRPSYYTLRYIETYLWGFEPARWYFMRIVLLGVSFALSWQALLFIMSPAQASLSLLFVLSGTYWGDVFCRLGPSEQYALLGCAAFCYGAAASLRALHAGLAPERRHWALVVFGSVLAGGSKENFVFVPGLLALLTGFALYRRRLSKRAAVFSGLALVYAAWVMLVVLISVRRNGANVYGEEAGLSSAPALALEAAWTLLRKNGKVIAFALAGALACFLYRRTASFARACGLFTLALLLCMGVYGLQAIVYKGHIPHDTRYEFPASVMGPLIVSVAYALFRRQAQGSLGASRVTFAIDAAVLSVATYLVANVGFRDIKDMAADNVERTQRFSKAVLHIAETLRAAPERPLLYTVGRPDLDLEPLVSTHLFLDYYGVTNPIFVSVEPGATGRLGDLIRDWSEHGLREWQGDEGLRPRHSGARAKFQPLRALPTTVPAFGIGLSSAPPPGVTRLSL